MTEFSEVGAERPVDTILHLGAGRCSRLEDYLALMPKRVLLVEADPQLAQELKSRTAHLPQIQVQCAAVAGSPGRATLYRYNLPYAGSLHPASGLLEFYPGLKETGRSEMETAAAAALVEPLHLQLQHANRLVVDIPGEELPVLQALQAAGQLQLFSGVWLFCGREPLYEGCEPASGILEWLREAGFDLVSEECGDDSDGACWKLQRNTLQTQNVRLEQQAETLRSQIEDLRRKNLTLVRHVGEIRSCLKTLEQEPAEPVGASGGRHVPPGQSAAAAEDLDGLLGGLRLQVEKLVRERRGQSRPAGDTAEQVAGIFEMLQSLKSRLDQVEKGLADTFGKGLENSTKQVESFIGIQTYLTRGRLLPDMHAWRVSPDFAFYVINLIEENEYDLIIEFGSGTSTILAAEAVHRQLKRRAAGTLLSEKHGGGKPPGISCQTEEDLEQLAHLPPAVSGPAAADPAKPRPRIVSFEHQRPFFEQTQAKLRRAGVAGMVELVLAPLGDYAASEGGNFLFYSCEETFAALSEGLSGDRAKVLVIVDGPPAVTGKHARYPALPIVLRHLAGHSLDILLDDYVRQDEKEIVEKWIKVLNERGLAYEKTILKMEKDACLIAIE